MGLCSYYRRFVPNFADVANPLHVLAQDTGTNLKWTEEANEAFQRLKQLLTSTPVLGYPKTDLIIVEHSPRWKEITVLHKKNY